MHIEAAVVRRFAANLAITAAAGQDGQAQTGIIIDRYDAKGSNFMVVVFPYTATLADTKVLKFSSVLVEHSDASDLSGAATFCTCVDTTPATIATGKTGGTTETGCKSYSVPISGAKRYLRLKYTPDLDASGTDTAALSAVAIFDPPQYLP